jgi:small acid-soluble spore protein H (minor)
MRLKRACEIVSSPIMANVTYYDVPVYIESVANANHTAKIHPLNQPNVSQIVSVSNLDEHV